MNNIGNNSIQNLPFHLQEILKKQIGSDEKLLWCTQPDPQRYFKRKAFFLLFGGFFTAFSVFWVVIAGTMIGFGDNFEFPFSLFPFFGIPFIFVGLYLIYTPFKERATAKQSVCAVTTKKAILIEGKSVNIYPPERLTQITTTLDTNGKGDVIFDKKVSHTTNGVPSYTEIGFLGIENPNEISLLLQKLSEMRS
jgi:hypothetical protein